MLLAHGIDFRMVNSEEAIMNLCARGDGEVIDDPAKPAKTAADYMVIALSPVLIMLLVGSLCFFLIEVFFRGEAGGQRALGHVLVCHGHGAGVPDWH